MQDFLDHADIKVRQKSSGIRQTSKSFYLAEPSVLTYTLRIIIPIETALVGEAASTHAATVTPQWNVTSQEN